MLNLPNYVLIVELMLNVFVVNVQKFLVFRLVNTLECKKNLFVL